jgi:microcompartment protein CcmL/EutN
MLQAQPAPVLIPTLGALELSSVARGLVVCDAMLKKANVRLLRATPLASGKFLVLLTGDEADLEEAVQEGQLLSDPHLVGWTCIPNIHPQVVDALRRRTVAEVPLDAVGVLEATSLVSALRSSDLAVKAAGVQLLELTFHLDLGGKAFFTITGDLSEVTAALEAGAAQLRADGAFVNQEIIARPHGDLGALLRDRQENPCF